MADSKITALTAISTVDPTADPLVIVDVSDTSMAASGTTKKSTINQLLGAGGTATLASATITGDLTVDTSTLKVDSANNRVGIGTASPNSALEVAGSIRTTNAGGSASASTGVFDYVAGTTTRLVSYGANTTTAGAFQFTGLSSNASIGDIRYGIDATGIHTWQNVDGVAGTAMTLNATGLGVGASPANDKLLSLGSMGILLSGATSDFSFRNSGGTAIQRLRYTDATGALTIGSATGTAYPVELGGNTTTRAVTIDASSNVGIGVTPSAWAATFKPVQIGSGTVSSAFIGQTNSPVARIMTNSYFDGTNFVKVQNNTAGMYVLSNNQHEWHNAVTGTGTFSFTQAMTLDASGNLLVGTNTNTNVSRIFSRGTATSSALALQGASGDVALAQLTVGKFDNNTTTSQIFVRFTINDNSGGSGQINANGASQAAFGTFSDSRLKENIVSLPSQLANILSLRPVEFDYKDGSGHQIGFVAQEMQEVYSDAVGEQNGFLTVTGWSKTEARLVSAIKELAAKVQALEAKLA